MMIILMGAPGVGKGTQAKVLSQKLKLRHISTGESLRQAIKQNTSLGSKARQYVESGRLVPDRLITRMVIQRLSRSDVKVGFILDGFPRNIQQAKDLDNFLSAKITRGYLVIYLDASEKTLIQRLSGRRLCNKCQAVFHLVNMPPKKDMRCDFCGAELYQRPDDKEETIKNRLQVYQEQTQPVIKYYVKKNRLLRIDANRGLKPVLNECLKLLKRKG
ncbi:MAG: adenylate kinase [Omnitrophica WOR_2 bacterium RIFCSPLOWO2_12_FULL_46_30]|nr:MAG: adenylate kinase [Omnitrophica WOR_2 bacterium RIFCSPHIGHO2_02_FULL_46_37]OGX43019.1 MAG: adenylate kinase [Omnitrophica WOR_2 bacterium RIFCSPLOWO2_02_FULL_45_28]OGX49886.1 MAG: adenylate kinase [Omnitrophica WOR_2 bacterium RIFCSPLOWO2_12_FULL_46_30]